jgi:CRP/FNR family transcriptional regulator
VDFPGQSSLSPALTNAPVPLKILSMTPFDFVKHFPAFRDTPEPLLRELLSSSSRQTVPAGTQLYRDGDACSGIAFVFSGDIRVYKIGHTGREITLYEIGPGETCILNASCILSGKSYPAYAVALVETDLMLLPSPLFLRMVAESEQMRRFVFSIMNERFTAVMELVEEVAFGRMDQRLLDYLIEKSGNNHLETTHQKIANDLGTSREVVSRLLKDLERKRVVSLSRNAITLLK